MATIDTDYLVIGSGLAGLDAAIRLAEGGKVVLVTKRALRDSNTSFSQGGIAAVISTDDSFESHVRDTLDAGKGLCDERVVQSIVADGPAVVQHLVELGVQFDREVDGYDLTREGGHRARRILHNRDLTGQEIDRALRDAVSRVPQVQCLRDHIAIDLITARKLGSGAQGDRCLGAYVLDRRSGEVSTICAKATLLATGGAGKVYLYTTNPDVATGDGIAIGYRAGLDIMNMEFFQFHPTCLYHPHAKNFLISEALRGEGGILRRTDGTPLMRDVHPMEDLAPRDVVARAIDEELKRTGDDCVLLDMSAREPSYLTRRFSGIHTACLSFGVDMTKAPIPVVPAAHYLCGGVRVDLQGATRLPGLWAAGEVAHTGLHGANRLASNSLLEAAVLAARAAADMKRFARDAEPGPRIPEWNMGDAVDPDEAVFVSHSWQEIRRVMWNYVGIVRDDVRLQRAKRRVELLREEIDDYFWKYKPTADLLELRNVAPVAELIIESASSRRESRGAHYSASAPETLDAWRHHTLLRRGVNHKIIREAVELGSDVRATPRVRVHA
jgi:L-aspartate oxidase